MNLLPLIGLIIGAIIGWVFGSALILAGEIIYDELTTPKRCRMIRSSELARIKRSLEAEQKDEVP